MKAIQIGWCNPDPIWSDLLYFKPEPLKVGIGCPSVGSWASRSFVVRAPYDLKVRFDGPRQNLEVNWENRDFEVGVHQILPFTKRKQWSAPDRPSMQWLLKNLFVSDEPVWAETWSPMYHEDANSWPGIVVPGKLNIQRWTRPLNWVFEWRDTNGVLDIKRGDPIQYVRFHTRDLDARFEIVQLDVTESVTAAVERCSKLLPFNLNAKELEIQAAKARPRRWL